MAIPILTRKVMVTGFHVVVLGRADASDKDVRILERTLLDALRTVSEEFKRKHKDFSLRISQLM